jgi:hypothetical protein
VPFLLSIILLARLDLDPPASPSRPRLARRSRKRARTSKKPLKEAFGQWSNAKIALLALFGATAGEAVVWYGGQFYSLLFLTQTLKVNATTAQIMIVVALAIGTPFFILFGHLSDKYGRKPIMLPASHWRSSATRRSLR